MSLTELFGSVVFLSLLGSILVIGIFLIKMLFRRKLSANWHYYIWFVLLLRLLIPFTPSTPLNVFNFLPHQQRIDFPQIPMASPERAASTTVTKTNENSANMSSGTSSGHIIKNSSATFAKFRFNWQTSALIWMMGIIAISLYILLVNGLLLFKTKKLPACVSKDILSILQECKSNLKVHSEVSVIYDDSNKSPALFGLFSPKIIISHDLVQKLSPEELRYIFLHELSHLKRRDLLFNGLVLAIQVFYWFNPLIWYALHQMKLDCEMACDATALATLKQEDHKKYGQTIISLLQLLSEPHWAPGTLGFVSKFNTRRIVMISAYKKTTLIWAIAALIMTLVAGCSSLNNPIKSNNTVKPPSKSQNQEAVNKPASPTKDTNVQPNTNPNTSTTPPSPADADSIVYKNTQYGFDFTLPAGWKGYEIITGKWEGYSNSEDASKITETGPLISIRHPQWTAQNPRQDIPILVFTLDQWNLLQQDKFHIGAAPIGPSELGRNGSYVLALPARYNFAFPTGYEEVEKILANHPLSAN